MYIPAAAAAAAVALHQQVLVLLLIRSNWMNFQKSSFHWKKKTYYKGQFGTFQDYTPKHVKVIIPTADCNPVCLLPEFVMFWHALSSLQQRQQQPQSGSTSMMTTSQQHPHHDTLLSMMEEMKIMHRWRWWQAWWPPPLLQWSMA